MESTRDRFSNSPCLVSFLPSTEILSRMVMCHYFIRTTNTCIKHCTPLRVSGPNFCRAVIGPHFRFTHLSYIVCLILGLYVAFLLHYSAVYAYFLDFYGVTYRTPRFRLKLFTIRMIPQFCRMILDESNSGYLFYKFRYYYCYSQRNVDSLCYGRY